MESRGCHITAVAQLYLVIKSVLVLQQSTFIKGSILQLFCEFCFDVKLCLHGDMAPSVGEGGPPFSSSPSRTVFISC